MENNNCKDENESNKLSHDEREGLYQNEIIYSIFEKHMVEIINEEWSHQAKVRNSTSNQGKKITICRSATNAIDATQV